VLCTGGAPSGSATGSLGRGLYILYMLSMVGKLSRRLAGCQRRHAICRATDLLLSPTYPALQAVTAAMLGAVPELCMCLFQDTDTDFGLGLVMVFDQQ
jgi:hypothetical protein